jgi:mono/diheme cytochrome c family protein
MRKYAALIALAALLPALCVVPGCTRLIGGAPERGHDARSRADNLYESSCAGCHGKGGIGGAARGLTDPIFLRIADAAAIRSVVGRGVANTAMPAFAQAAGGSLTAGQIDAIVEGLRSGSAGAGGGDPAPPPYAASAPGDPARGGDVFAAFCARCHGADGRGGPRAGSIVDPGYLALVSDQSLRTTIIAGRPDLDAPDWRGNVPGRPMSAQEVSDAVAWLAARRLP